MNSKGNGELIIISIMLLWVEQGWRSGESTRLSAPTWPGFVSGLDATPGLSLMVPYFALRVFSRVLRSSPLIKNQKFDWFSCGSV